MDLLFLPIFINLVCDITDCRNSLPVNMLVNPNNVFCHFDFLQKNKLMFKFRGSSKRTNLIEVGRDIMASNGIIHIVTKLMTHEPNIPGDPNVSFAFFSLA